MPRAPEINISDRVTLAVEFLIEILDKYEYTCLMCPGWMKFVNELGYYYEIEDGVRYQYIDEMFMAQIGLLDWVYGDHLAVNRRQLAFLAKIAGIDYEYTEEEQAEDALGSLARHDPNDLGSGTDVYISNFIDGLSLRDVP